MSLDSFLGIWINEIGNQLIIEPNDRKSVLVTFLTYRDKKPVNRTYFNDIYSVDMTGHLDYYGTSLEVELWEQGKGFHLSLMLDQENENELSPGISRYSEDTFLDKYYHLFMPLQRFKKETIK